MIWVMKHPKMTVDVLGNIPSFLNEEDPRPAWEQFDEAYKLNGGWRPFKGFIMRPDGNMSYPGDRPTRLLAETKLRNETVRFYEHSWIAVIQPNGSYEVVRMD